MTVRLGLVSYLNAFPYLYGLERELLQAPAIGITFGTPAQLNRKMAQQELDLALLSSIELAWHTDRYFAFPDLGIGVKGAAGSVLLFCQVPLEDLKEKTIAVTSASATGVNLLKVLLERRWEIEGVTLERRMGFRGIRDQFPAILLIGDEALSAQREWKESWVCYDLGKVWNEWTGLPFVFALWTGSKQWARERPEETDAVWNYLRRAVACSQENWSQMVREAEKRWMGYPQAGSYLERFDYRLQESHRDGLTAFYQWGKRLDLLTQVPSFDSFIKEEIHVKR